MDLVQAQQTLLDPHKNLVTGCLEMPVVTSAPTSATVAAIADGRGQRTTPLSGILRMLTADARIEPYHNESLVYP